MLSRALTPAVRFSHSCSSPCSIHLAPSSMSALFVIPPARVEQQTHGVHLRSLVLTSRHHHTPVHGILQLEETVFPLQSRLISGEVHISAESTEQRHRLNNQAASPPNGKLGHHFRGFATRQQIRIGECELQGVMTSRAVNGLRCADVHECTCINHEMTRKTAGRTTEGTN